MEEPVRNTSVNAKLQIGIARTSGDGMDQEAISQNEASNKSINTVQIGKSHSHHLGEKSPTSFPCSRNQLSKTSTETLGTTSSNKLYYLVPKLIASVETPEHKRTKKPRFIPFEPYKCAINPIIPPKKNTKYKKSRNNLDLNILVSQMSDMKTTELNISKSPETKSVQKVEVKEREEELKKQIEDLKKDRDYYQSQLKFQVQVNSELKNLLVAAVGEDMQTKVNVLTEDKLQLARALLDTANNLSTHTEQIEFLAGQCEVWRSKFLASSVMVEELARWKADLSHKNALLSESSKQMLQLVIQIRDMQLDLLQNLKFLAKLKHVNPPSSDVITLTSECLNISQQMVLHSGIGMPERLTLKNNNTLTEAEKTAIKALECISQPLMSTDEVFRAILGQAFSSKTSGNISVRDTSSNCGDSDQL